ncbi:phospholipase D-like domain-containing protein [Thalassoroseus pseudoceratinae]|uniref:phospholipase D-like domain-containing protein n=1 Tax=Thalassoroseus pseudoceratinae TaxID=2713176 RepID=UPI00141F0C3E|nr:phospholipase D-like domain-containing protein [Thalassoroseus pseudoceratinae]
MDLDQIRYQFEQTLDDRRLSRSEKRALSRVLDGVALTPHNLSVLRRLAFEVAATGFNDVPARETLGWLEDVIKLLVPSPEDSIADVESHFSPGDDCPTRIASLFQTAKRTVDVCVFTITDNRIASAIADAHRRGILVRIITDDDKSFDAGSDVERLASIGIEVRRDRSPYHMHHKFAIFDQQTLLTGSYNWTRGAAEYNEENFILSGDLRLIKPFQATFDQLWQQFAATN